MVLNVLCSLLSRSGRVSCQNAVTKFVLGSATLLLLACGGSTEKQADEKALTSVHYRCNGGEEIVVEYDNSDADNSVAYVQLSSENPEKIKMTIAVSASGARYTDGKLVWWTKGETAFLTSAEEGETPIYEGCVEFDKVE